MTTTSLPRTTPSRLTTTIIGGLAAVTIAVVAAVPLAAGRGDTSAPATSGPAPVHLGSADALERRATTAPQTADFGSPDAAEHWLQP